MFLKNRARRSSRCPADRDPLELNIIKSAPKKSKAARVSEIEANRKKEKEAIRERNTAETMNRQGILPESEKDAAGPQAVSPITRMLQEALDNALKGGSNDSNNS